MKEQSRRPHPTTKNGYFNPLPLPKRHPTLTKLRALGLVWLDYPNYAGIASDGTIVSFGLAVSIEDFNRIERYLSENPSPEDW